ncbi:hypothetical protein PSEUBRA_003948 [Kalmanozyma brasiliensis GHG001]|uniref:uncharacterized protein n=1 Tax=Kalmanozyma brasiliensis (strain GHG001) TaxID=1365824 RepID=UPI0028681C66|nr:uncharacterized protein PSEUBRA_003948 [Kalmanozyma brasiliensis GHG001]EST06089.2 hypothetical protein PSEUBRA_003948 [Kalmanozyma brasiliensis GHG001]
MLSFFRKTKSTISSSVMTNANTSETTLVPATKTGKRKTPRQTQPYQAEFTGMGGFGGMPNFLEPPVAAVKMVPAQPFKSTPRASFVDDRVSVLKGRESFDTLATTVAAPASSSSTSPQRKLLKQHKAFFNNSFSNT